MGTGAEVWPANAASIRRTAALVRAGGLVAFPTETVYGLGVNALDEAAVLRLFRAKGRPATNPVIVHVADATDVHQVADEWPESARILAAKFWPGPLTLVLPKAASVPAAATAGGPTVAVRCPAHPVALALLREAGVPIAAPSANRSGELSPTTAAHVVQSLGDRIDAVLDGGPCSVGIESTVLDVTGQSPHILRPGPITGPMIETIIGPITGGRISDGPARSPGQSPRHYAPRTAVELAENLIEAEAIRRALERAGFRVHFLTFPDQPDRAAAELYARLHALDDGSWDRIVIVLPPDRPEWAAVRDRIIRSAAEQ
ncbi:MAG TPA: L-threonylcarbamoyladenylate synthase [Fimbriiglobus sp.]